MDKFKGAKMVLMISVLEGNGENVPYRDVHYFYDPNKMYLAGTHGACIGSIDPYREGSIASQDKPVTPHTEEKEG